jgi:hypothetical protein
MNETKIVMLEGFIRDLINEASTSKPFCYLNFSRINIEATGLTEIETENLKDCVFFTFAMAKGFVLYLIPSDPTGNVSRRIAATIRNNCSTFAQFQYTIEEITRECYPLTQSLAEDQRQVVQPKIGMSVAEALEVLTMADHYIKDCAKSRTSEAQKRKRNTRLSNSLKQTSKQLLRLS